MFTLKHKTISVFAALLLGLVLQIGLLISPVSAETIECADGSVRDVAESDSANPEALCASAGGIKSGAEVQPSTNADSPAATEFKADCKDVDPDTGKAAELTPENCKIIDYLQIFINVLSALVGIIVTIMIIVGGIQYSAAGADPGAVEKAKKRIFNAIFALIAFGLLYAFLDFIIPGGVFFD